MKPPDGMETGKLAAAIELSVNRDKARSLADQENDARLMEAVALFATPGALAAAFRRGLSAEQRVFCAEWFAGEPRSGDAAWLSRRHRGVVRRAGEGSRSVPHPLRRPPNSLHRHEFGREKR